MTPTPCTFQEPRREPTFADTNVKGMTGDCLASFGHEFAMGFERTSVTKKNPRNPPKKPLKHPAKIFWPN